MVLEKDCGQWHELYCTITTNNDGEEDLEQAKEALRRAAEIGYDALLAEHSAWWQSYWAKSEIQVGDPLLEQVYYRSQYLFASAASAKFRG